jgi:hypothetical protein
MVVSLVPRSGGTGRVQGAVEMTITVTLAEIRAGHPCQDGWGKLLEHLGKVAADDEPLPLLAVMDSNGLEDAFWVLSNIPRLRLESRLFGAWCARQVLHIFEAGYPDDMRVRRAIEVAENPNSTAEELAAARAAAIVATRAADADAGFAAGAAALAAVRAASNVALAAALAALAADDAKAAQERDLRQFCTEGTLP